MRTIMLLLLSCLAPAAAAPPGPAAPEIVVRVQAPWSVQHQDEDSIVLRLADSPDGVRVNLGDDGLGRVVGVTPIVKGRTLEVEQDGARWPLVAVGYPDRPLSKVEVEVTGVDLVVRLAGPPLKEVSTHPEAPADPVLTWARIRPRGSDWRIVVTGLATLSLPGVGEVQALDDGEIGLHSGWGIARLDTEAPRHDSGLGAERWWLSTVPSLVVYEPYERTSLTLIPHAP